MSNDNNRRTVYSTEHGAMCPDCGRPSAQCVCPQIRKNTVASTDGIARVRFETRGRKGKGVTVVTGLPLSVSGLVVLCKMLKQRMGTGGTVKNGAIELQGDHRDMVSAELRKKGFAV